MSDGDNNPLSGGGAAAALLGDDPAKQVAADPAAGADLAADPAAVDQGAADPDWYNQLSTDVAEGEKASLFDFVKARGAKTVDQLAQALRDAQRTIHDKGLIKLPGEGASDEDRAAFNKAIGVPDNVEGYTIEAPQDAEGNPVELDKGLLDRLKATALKSGAPAETFKALVQDVVAYQMEQLAGVNAEQQQEARDWARSQGDKQSAKLAAVDRGAVALGLEDGEVLKLRSSLGPKRTMDLLARLGEGVGEDVLTGGTVSRQAFVNADQAQSQIDAMMKDPAARAAIFIKGSPENTRYQRLLAIAGEGANRRASAG